jgi:hypothetical protein
MVRSRDTTAATPRCEPYTSEDNQGAPDEWVESIRMVRLYRKREMCW